MDKINQFKEKACLLQNKVHKLYSLLEDLKENIIKNDLASALSKIQALKKGTNLIDCYDWIEEVIIDGELFNFIDRKSEKYKAYVAYTEREYNTLGLGFMYKNDIVSPHIEGQIDNIIYKYKENELEEIMCLIDKRLISIGEDIDYLEKNKNIKIHKHYYRNYSSGGFEGGEKFMTIIDVINDFKSL